MGGFMSSAKNGTLRGVPFGEVGDRELKRLSSLTAVRDGVLRALGGGDGKDISCETIKEYVMARDTWLRQEDVAQLLTALDASDGRISCDALRAGLEKDNLQKPLLLWLMALNPPPAGVGVFNDLIRQTGSPVDIPDPAHRAMTLRQLKAVMEHAQERCLNEAWLGKRFVDGVLRFERLQPRDCNLYDVATHVILPATHGHRLPDGATQPSFVELVADAEQKPDYFASHFWGEPIVDFIACVAQHTRDRAYGDASFATLTQGKKTKGADGDSARVWVCAYANRQWSLAADVTDDPSQTSFFRAMRLSRGTLAIVDARGQYFSRTWCCYEITVSLSFEESQRDAEACAKGRYTYDVYTAHEYTPNDPEMGRRQAVGITDGIAPADEGYLPGGGREARSKVRREEAFPPALFALGLHAKVQDGEASVPSDKVHILNRIIGGERDLNAEPPAQHPEYDRINAILQGRVAVSTLAPAIRQGGELLDAALQRLAASRETSVSVSLGHGERNKGATADVMTRVVEAMPTSLEHLSLRNCHELRDVSRLAGLTQLRTLDLFHCTKLETLPDLQNLTQLQTLNVGKCTQLRSLPDLGHLKKVDVNTSGCRMLGATSASHN